MKIMITFLSLLIIFAGIIPFFGDKSFIPNKGTGYSIVLIVLGILVIIFGIINQLLMGVEKIFIVLQGLLVIGAAVLRFIPALLPSIPRDGVIFDGIIILIGFIGFFYGVIGMG